MRSVLAVVLGGLASGVAQATCYFTPMPETSSKIRSLFAERMQKFGANDWHLSAETPRGSMYYSATTRVKLFIKDTNNSVEETGLLLPPESTTDDAVRMEAAAIFLGALISGSPESDLQPRIVSAIAATRRDGTGRAVREQDAVLIFSSPEPGAVALVAGRMRCR